MVHTYPLLHVVTYMTRIGYNALFTTLITKACVVQWIECRPPDSGADGSNHGVGRYFLYARLQTGRIMVWWCPSVRPSGSPSVHPSVRPSVRPSQFSALFSYMLWHNDLKFCVSLYFYARKIKFECHQFPSLFAGVMLLFNFKLL